MQAAASASNSHFGSLCLGRARRGPHAPHENKCTRAPPSTREVSAKIKTATCVSVYINKTHCTSASKSKQILIEKTAHTRSHQFKFTQAHASSAVWCAGREGESFLPRITRDDIDHRCGLPVYRCRAADKSYLYMPRTSGCGERRRQLTRARLKLIFATYEAASWLKSHLPSTPRRGNPF